MYEFFREHFYFFKNPLKFYVGVCPCLFLKHIYVNTYKKKPAYIAIVPLTGRGGEGVKALAEYPAKNALHAPIFTLLMFGFRFNFHQLKCQFSSKQNREPFL